MHDVSASFIYALLIRPPAAGTYGSYLNPGMNEAKNLDCITILIIIVIIITIIMLVVLNARSEKGAFFTHVRLPPRDVCVCAEFRKAELFTANLSVEVEGHANSSAQDVKTSTAGYTLTVPLMRSSSVGQRVYKPKPGLSPPPGCSPGNFWSNPLCWVDQGTTVSQGDPTTPAHISH
uniref:Uncharacterized protein n=1 Tax=Anopheles farauti TaxID=69004 RepID=A0A182Q091_9DIPT